MTRRRMLTVLALFGATLFMLAACADMGPPSPPSAAEASPPTPIYYANIYGLPLRKGPTTSDPEVSTLQFNDEVQLLETKDGWGRVLDVRRNIEGWAAMRYLQPSPAVWPRQMLQQERPASQRAAPIYYANIAGLPLRKGPTTSDPEVSTLQWNDEVQLLETKDGWARVLDVHRNIEGWADMRYLQPSPANWPRRLLGQERPASQRAAPKPSGNPPQPSEAPVSKSAEASPPLPIYYANISGLPLRKGPTTSDPEVSTLQWNDEVQLLETKDGWGRVLDVHRNIEGWAAMRYLQPSPANWPRRFLR
ncbi:MAG: SH3 domain-containing protein [Desulfobaccales bacterium]